jgi:hypothetical protein
MFGDSRIFTLEIVKVLTGDAACCFGVLLVICRDSSYNSHSFPCLNFCSLSWMVAFIALLCLLLSDNLTEWAIDES